MPDTKVAKKFVEALVSGSGADIMSGVSDAGSGRGDRGLVLGPWIGGLDAEALTRAIQEEIKAAGA